MFGARLGNLRLLRDHGPHLDREHDNDDYQAPHRFAPFIAGRTDRLCAVSSARSSVEYGRVHHKRRGTPDHRRTHGNRPSSAASGLRLRVRTIGTVTVPRKDAVQHVKTVSTLLLLASMVGFQPAPVQARDRDRGDRFEDRNDGREDKKDKDKKDKHYKKDHRKDERSGTSG